MNNITLLKLEDIKLFINGEWKGARSNSSFVLSSPSTEEKITKVPNGGQHEAQIAIQSAKNALENWSNLSAYSRAEYLLKIRDLMFKYQEELATIMSSEMGKAYKESKGEVAYAASFLTWYAEEGKRIYGRTIPGTTDNKRLMVINQPVGVVAAITPWNFPLAMMTRKLGPALAAGCTSVVKPASQSPLSALAFAKLVELAGVPKGVVNIIAGDTKSISNEIFDNPIVKKVSFTGSTDVGKMLVEKSSPQLKKLSLELGGHAPLIVFEDADLELAAEGALASKFRNAGQTCVCANRIYVHKNIIDKFTNIFDKKVKELKIGDSLNGDTDVGALVSEDGLEKVKEHVEDAINKGAEVITGGEILEGTGYFYKPTILSKVTNEMLIMNEETFGPVAPIISFTNEDEVIKEANKTEYGLAAYLYTKDISRSIKVSEALDFGVIGLNDAMPGVAQAPFGGMKHSGYGREGGKEGIEDFLEKKYISLGI